MKKIKLLAIKRGITLKSLIEKLILNEIEEISEKEKINFPESLLKALENKRKEGLIPFLLFLKKVLCRTCNRRKGATLIL